MKNAYIIGYKKGYLNDELMRLTSKLTFEEHAQITRDTHPTVWAHVIRYLAAGGPDRYGASEFDGGKEVEEAEQGSRSNPLDNPAFKFEVKSSTPDPFLEAISKKAAEDLEKFQKYKREGNMAELIRIQQEWMGRGSTEYGPPQTCSKCGATFRRPPIGIIDYKMNCPVGGLHEP